MKLIRNALACAAIFVTLSVTTAFADEIGLGVVTGSCVNVREQPNTSCNVVKQFWRGQQVSVIGASGEWLQVSFDGGEGWMHSDYVDVRKGEVSRSGDQVDREAVPLSTKVINYAKQYLGVPYVYGGSSPKGFDCSGFTQYVFKNFGISLNRVAASQASNGTKVEKSNLSPGDLVFFRAGKSSRISHVGIYVGGGQFIHSSSPGSDVKYDSINQGYYATNYVTARRVIQ